MGEEAHSSHLPALWYILLLSFKHIASHGSDMSDTPVIPLLMLFFLSPPSAFPKGEIDFLRVGICRSE